MSRSRMKRKARTRQLRARMKAHVLERFAEVQRLSGDSLGGVIDLIKYVGLDEVIQLLVNPQENHSPPAGFVRLMQNDRARYTLEQTLVEFADSSLLTRLQVETARDRLASYSRLDR